MPVNDAVIFSTIASILAAIGIVDYHTMQIPLLFILGGIILVVAGILIGLITWTAAFWGIFIGAVIPGMISKEIFFSAKLPTIKIDKPKNIDKVESKKKGG